MKNSIPKSVLLGFFLLVFNTSAFSQLSSYGIVPVNNGQFPIFNGTTLFFCDSICDAFTIQGSGMPGTPGADEIAFVEWSIIGLDGNSIQYQQLDSISIFACFGQPGATINAFIFFANGAFIDTSLLVIPQEPLIIYETFSDAFLFCPNANGPPGQSGGINNCDVVCPNTTVTYSFEYSGIIQQIGVGGLPGISDYNINYNTYEIEVTWSEPGFHVLELLFLGACGSFITSICTEVLEEPIADFTSAPPPVNDTIYLCQGQTLSLQNASQYATSYSWNFGNGQLSEDTDPTTTYPLPGVYTLTLDAFNDCLCSNSISRTVVVEATEVPIVDCIGTICENTIATYEAAAGCSTYLWSISSNGVIIDGGGASDDYITVDWGVGPEGLVELSLMDCASGNVCMEPAQLIVPILSDEGNIVGDDNVCRGDIEAYSITSYEGTSFDWSVSSYGTIIDGQGTEEILVQWFDGGIPGNPMHWVAVEYDNCYLGCGGRDTLEVFINPEFFTTGPLEVCYQDSTQHQASSLPGNNSVLCNWYVVDSSGDTVWTTSTPTSSPIIPWNVANGTYQVIASPDMPDAYCTPFYRTPMNVRLLPEITSNLEGDTLVCPGTVHSFEIATNDSLAILNWEINDGGIITTLQGSSVNYIFGNTPPYEISVYAEGVFGCRSAVYSQLLDFIPAPIIAGDLENCVEAISTFSTTAYDVFSYEWTIIPSDRGTIVGLKDGADIDVTWHSAGPAEVVVALCGQLDTLEVMVNGLPEPGVIHPDGVCPGTQATVQADGVYDSYSWYDENGTLLASTSSTMLSAGTYELEVTDEFGCIGAVVFNMEEYPEPNVNITTPDPNIFCNTTIFTRLYANETDDGYNYQWFNDGVPIGTNSSAYIAVDTGVYYVQVIDINGCEDFSNVIIVGEDCINGPPIPAPACPSDPAIGIIPTMSCDTRQYQDLSVGAIASYWIFDDPASGVNNTSTLPNPTHTFTEVGFYRVFLLSTFQVGGDPDSTYQCPDWIVDTVLVKADFTADTVCANTETAFKDLSTYLSITNIASWQWDFGDPASGVNNTSTLPNPTHTYVTPGLYTVTLTIAAPTGCTSTISKVIEVRDAPDASFILPDLTCEDIALTFMANAGVEVNTLSWDFGDPSSGDANMATTNTTYHDYMTPGTYTVTLDAMDIFGCENSYTDDITITPNLLSGDISSSAGFVSCEGDSIMLSAPAGGISWQWNTGATTESIMITETGEYSVTITDTEGCVYTPSPAAVTFQAAPETVIRLVEFNELFQPINYYYDFYEACEGVDVTLEVISNPDYSYEWSTGDSGTLIEFLEERDEQLVAGTYTFDVTITNSITGCTNVSDSFEIVIHPLPNEPLITSSPSGANCEGDLTTFQVSNPQDSVDYVWNNGFEGTSMQTALGGEYYVTAINTFGCRAESNHLNIIPGPDISLVPNGCYTRCRPDTLCLPDIPNIDTYQWLFNGSPIGPSSSSPPELVALQSGIYQLEMLSIFGCTLTSDPLELELYDGVGTILGQVWVDVNDNGIIDAADSLYTGAAIQLWTNATIQDTSFSNELGNYAFPNIEANNYSLLLDSLSYPANLEAYYTQIDTLLQGCDNQIAINWLLQDLCVPDTTFTTLSGCDSVAFNGTAYYQDTSLQLQLTSLIGCDSTVELTIEVLQSSPTTINQLSACEGTSIMIDGNDIMAGDSLQLTYTNVNGCDSMVQFIVNVLQNSSSSVNLQACEGETIDYNGTSLDAGSQQDIILMNALGCDSIVTVTVETLMLDSTTLTLQTCEGSTIAYNGTSLNPGDQQDFTFTNSSGCDSVVTVLVDALNLDSTTLMLQACQGETVDYNGTSINAGNQQSFTFTNVSGCDSVVTVMVEELIPDSISLTLQICEGGSVDYNGTSLNSGDQQDFTFTNTSGCDSVVTVMVEGLAPDSTTLMLQACEGSTIDYNGTTLSPGDQQDFTLTDAMGCDSVVTVMVEGLVPDSSTLMLQACEGSTIDYNGTTLSPGDQQDFTLTDAMGCDSVVTVIVEGLVPDSSTLMLQACEGSTIDYNGTTLSPGDQQDFTLTDAMGCDSVVTVMVEELFADSSSLTLQACPGNTVTYNGTTLNPGDQQDFILVNQDGCDSTVTVFVEALSTSDTTLNLAACEGETITYNGVPLLAGTEAVFTYLNVDGCDSMVTVVVEALMVSDTTIQFSACEGNSIVFDGTSILAGGQQTFTYQNTAGCDSVITVIVQELAVYEDNIDLQACEGDSVSFNGQLIAAGSSVQLMYTTVAGCDSIINVNVEALMSSTASLDFVVCPGEAITYNGELLEAEDQAVFVLTNSVGCDSIVNVSVTASDPILVEVSTEHTCPNFNSGIAGIELLPGSASPLTFDLDGQGFSTDLTYIGLAAGEHQFFIVDENDCDAVVDFTIESEPQLIINIAARAISCEESTGQLNAAVISGDDGSVQLIWNEGTIGTLLESEEAGTYQLLASNNCEEVSLEAVIQDLRPNELSLLYVPNAFSPNDDGVNDIFRTYTSPDAFWRDYHFMVFDRWGDMIFETTNPEEGWDGTYRGVEMNDAVHVWHVEGTVESCGRVFEVQREGGVVIVR